MDFWRMCLVFIKGRVSMYVLCFFHRMKLFLMLLFRTSVPRRNILNVSKLMSVIINILVY
jgi:hypothetical protein